MKPSDVDDNLCPGRDRENSRLTDSVPNDESSVLCTVLYDDRRLGSSMKDYDNSEIRLLLTTGNILKVSYSVLH